MLCPLAKVLNELSGYEFNVFAYLNFCPISTNAQPNVHSASTSTCAATNISNGMYNCYKVTIQNGSASQQVTYMHVPM